MEIDARNSGFIFIFVTLSAVIIGQLCIKSGMIQIESLSQESHLGTLIRAFGNFRVIFGLLMAVVAACTWILALSQLPLSYAYPFMSLTFPTVLFLASRFFDEPLSPRTYVGISLIVVGLIVASSRT